MIRDWFSVPRVSAGDRAAIYGERTQDPRVEFVALTVRYWIDAHATRSMTRERVLQAMAGRITADNVWDLVRMLARLGLADEFFDLAASDVDNDGAFRRFLLGLDPVLIDAIRHYDAWSGINPKVFLDGFFVGVGESVATVVVDLGKLVQLIGHLQQEQMKTLIVLTVDPEAGLARLADQATVLREALAGIVTALDPTTVPERLLALWRGWVAEFARHLENLDPFSAGKLLGRIAGDLYQLLTSLVHLVRLLGGVAVRAAVRYVPLLIVGARQAAADIRLLTGRIAALLVAVGRAAILATPQVGLAVLRTLFPPKVLEALFRQGRALLADAELTLTVFNQAAHAEAFAGAGAGARLSAMVSADGKPLLMACMSETVSSAGRSASRAELNEALDEIIKRIEDLRELKPPKAPRDIRAAAVRAAIAKQLEQRLTTVFNRVLQTVAYEEFRALRKAGQAQPWRLGQAVHRRMAAEITQLLGGSPGLQPFAEKSLATVVETIAKANPELGAAMRGSETVLRQTVAQMLLGHPDRDLLLRLVGFTGSPSAKGAEKALASHLAERFGWKASTTVGELRSDLLLVDPEAARVTNVDWTSSTKLERFEKTWGTVADDLGETFDGRWEALAEAYGRAAKGGVPEQVVAGLEELTAHAVRETVVRQAALSQLFPGFFVTSHEMTYQGLHSLFKIPL
ncbi:hypothetical protein GA0070213_10510 [Micromonospora humi]|uniref:Uncharacterized protein n=2 Tax=Micromonospora humi TaxID=745366 RepID=A0A1C5I6X8_9ACTN|nr:hypothetical protein GA0070213_10510 [Micromonospora humi]